MTFINKGKKRDPLEWYAVSTHSSAGCCFEMKWTYNSDPTQKWMASHLQGTCGLPHISGSPRKVGLPWEGLMSCFLCSKGAEIFGLS